MGEYAQDFRICRFPKHNTRHIMKEIAKLYLTKVKISIQQIYYEKSENANHRIGDDIHNIDI